MGEILLNNHILVQISSSWATPGSLSFRMTFRDSGEVVSSQNDELGCLIKIQKIKDVNVKQIKSILLGGQVQPQDI